MDTLAQEVQCNFRVCRFDGLSNAIARILLTTKYTKMNPLSCVRVFRGITSAHQFHLLRCEEPFQGGAFAVFKVVG
jgi:hypothetical protein